MNFKEYSFSDLLSNIVDNRGRTCPVQEDGMPLIATNCIKNDSLYPVYEKIRFVSDETYQNWFRGHPEPGDLIFVCKGTPGRVALVPNPVPFCIAQDMVAIRADEDVLDPKFLFALLRSSETQEKIGNMHVGTLIPHFKKGDFKNLYLTIPEDKEYQKQVGEIYYNFSLKIENNTQINQTLEAMAQALFKSWFVDFDPVKAKMEARASGASDGAVCRAAMAVISGKSDEELVQFEQENPDAFGQLAATADLFPEALVESELGLIPEGWEVSSVGEEFNVTMGQSPKGETYNETGVGTLFFQGRAEFTWRFPLPRLHTTDPKRMAKVGDTLMSVRAPVGDVNIALNDCCVGRGLCAVRHKSGCESYTYYQFLELKRVLDSYNGEGTVFGSINQNDLKKIMVVKPSIDIVRQFSSVVSDCDKEIKNRSLENLTLGETRDTLLPKLLSGEIDLSSFDDREGGE